MNDELRAIERDAREQGEADLMRELDTLLRAHASAWWRDIEADDYVTRVNTTYEALIAQDGGEAYYDANWRQASDEAKEGRR